VYSGSRIHQTPQVRQLFIRQFGLFQFCTPTTGLGEKLGEPTARLNLAVAQVYINFIVYFHWLIPVSRSRLERVSLAQSGVRDVTFLGVKISPESLVISITIFIMVWTTL